MIIFLNLKLQDLLRATIQAQEAIDKRLQDRLPSKGEAASGEFFKTSFEITFKTKCYNNGSKVPVRFLSKIYFLR